MLIDDLVESIFTILLIYGQTKQFVNRKLKIKLNLEMFKNHVNRVFWQLFMRAT